MNKHQAYEKWLSKAKLSEGELYPSAKEAFMAGWEMAIERALVYLQEKNNG
jgi:hypothetical protein